LEGWEKATKAISIDELSTSVISLQQEGNPHIQRNIVIMVKPKGLKRYVEFRASHHVTNDTDQTLELRSLSK
jgi:hypothetical protein